MFEAASEIGGGLGERKLSLWLSSGSESSSSSSSSSSTVAGNGAAKAVE